MSAIEPSAELAKATQRLQAPLYAIHLEPPPEPCIDC
jgi:hypothetical protein